MEDNSVVLDFSAGNYQVILAFSKVEKDLKVGNIYSTGSISFFGESVMQTTLYWSPKSVEEALSRKNNKRVLLMGGGL